MKASQHRGHEHLAGEHPLGDALQLVFLVVFLAVWILDSWVLHFTAPWTLQLPIWLRISLTIPVALTAWILASRGMKEVFGTKREQAEVIDQGVFSRMRHPIYTGALLFYLALCLLSFSTASFGLFLIIVLFYIFISRYEERLLEQKFGSAYLKYKKKTGMLFPRLSSQ